MQGRLPFLKLVGVTKATLLRPERTLFWRPRGRSIALGCERLLPIVWRQELGYTGDSAPKHKKESDGWKSNTR
jgi:hypothetical protein